MPGTLRRGFHQWRWGGLACALLASAAWAEVTFGPAGAPNWTMEKWTSTYRQAPKQHSFKGVFIVSMPSAASVSSSRITHVARNGDVVERIEALTGPQRITYRHNNEVSSFFTDAKVVRQEHLGASGALPGSVGEKFKAASAQYRVSPGARTRVAGYDAYTVDFKPVDALRFGYRVWSDVGTGLVLKMQTVGPNGAVLEQSEFSELAMDAPGAAEGLLRDMKEVPAGYKVMRTKTAPAQLAAEGWMVRDLPSGFELVTCYKRDQAKSQGWLQCVFSDGMASVSIFLERYDAGRHRQEGKMAMGATHTLVVRSVDAQQHEWWATVVGEVPTATLRAILTAMERIPAKSNPTPR